MVQNAKFMVYRGGREETGNGGAPMISFKLDLVYSATVQVERGKKRFICKEKGRKWPLYGGGWRNAGWLRELSAVFAQLEVFSGQDWRFLELGFQARLRW